MPFVINEAIDLEDGGEIEVSLYSDGAISIEIADPDMANISQTLTISEVIALWSVLDRILVETGNTSHIIG